MNVRATTPLTFLLNHRPDCPDLVNERSPGRLRACRRYADGVLKRGFDVVAAGLGLLLVAPLLLAIALLIRAELPGPVLYCQMRHGRRKVPFRILKFRSMRLEAPGERFRQATRDDDRITRIGRFLRRTSLDELPQLINVLRGDMSIVGPRPHPLPLDEYYDRLLPDYDQRYSVRPGITGLAQVNGARGETPSVRHMAWRVRNDLDYVARSSPTLDLAILLATARTVVAATQAY